MWEGRGVVAGVQGVVDDAFEADVVVVCGVAGDGFVSKVVESG